MEYAIRIENVSKSFGSVIANNNISLNLEKGEILALLGENGSGKTTLMNMLAGIYYPDSGEIYVNNEKVNIHSPKDSLDLGIGMIHQHFKLVDIFSAFENIILGTKKKRFKESRNEILELIKKYGFRLDLDKKIFNMSVGEKQTVEIIKVLYRGADILILDEPTAVLTPQEIEILFDVLRTMKNAGKSIIIITHKLNEVMEISDRVSILRKGEYINTVTTKFSSSKELTDMMVGHKVELRINRPITNMEKPLLEIRNLTVLADDGNEAIKKVSFYIRGGEILGVAGISGCGQKELCEAIAGLRPIKEGLIMHKGESIIGSTAKEIIEKGISMSFIPEDRLGMGLAPNFSITDNVMLKSYNDTKGPFVNRKIARLQAEKLIEKLGIVTPSTETPVRRLSGGNVQKVLVGREIDSNPNVIVTAYPVRGLDINSSYAIYDILNRQKEKGVGILFVGEDLDVMLALCDKIMVLCHGEVMGVVNANKSTKEELGLMMTGSLDLKIAKDYKKLGFANDSNLTEEQWNSFKEALENEANK